MISRIRHFFSVLYALYKMLPLIGLLIVLAPVQWFALRTGKLDLAGRLPMKFHKLALWCMGVRVHLDGEPLADAPVLLVGNHVSWLDIVILGSIAPLRFVSKDDVASWPVFGTLARLQRTVFVSRTRRISTGDTAQEMSGALAGGDRLVLFAEGTSSHGGHVLPFRSALLGAVMGEVAADRVQAFSLGYVRCDGLPISRAERAGLGWYGDMDLLPSLLHIIHGGPMDIVVHLSAPQPASSLGTRKQAAKALELQVRRTLSGYLRHWPGEQSG